MSISSKRLNGLRMSHGPTSFENLYDVHVSDVDDSQSTSGNSVSIDPILDAAIGCSESDRRNNKSNHGFAQRYSEEAIPVEKSNLLVDSNYNSR
ncbi:hypothetical protein V6N13_098699 [Hibiscus sabdariffa]